LILHQGLGSDEEDASEEEKVERLLYAWPGIIRVCVLPPSLPPSIPRVEMAGQRRQEEEKAERPRYVLAEERGGREGGEGGTED
jgi:hypothetical protein